MLTELMTVDTQPLPPAHASLWRQAVLRPGPGRVRIQTLVLLRWIAVIGQGLALILVHYGLDFPLPLAPAIATVGVPTLLNIVLFLAYPASARLSDAHAALYLAFDLAQLTVLLYFTGGLENPFALLMLVPVTISATILSLRSTVWLGLLAVAGVSALALAYQPLPWSAHGVQIPPLYRLGAWAALTLGIGFVSAYVWQVADEARRMSDALVAAHLALARERQLSALGGLAAAAAHELGTPLGTIVLAAREVARELPADSPLAEDARLLVQQAQRCREILARFAGRPEEQAGGEAMQPLPLAGLVDLAAAAHRRAGIALTVDAQPGAQPMASRSPEIVHGLGNLIQNATDFAQAQVTLALRWDDREVWIEVLDDGPGINVDILSALGEPYVTSRADRDGMGLGVFIAKTLLEHTGASVAFANRPGGGAKAVVRWLRPALEGARA
jgi:two-component system sensor histidine kinase RegB